MEIIIYMNHVLAIIVSLIAVIFLAKMAIKMKGGAFGKTAALVSIGVFFSVFVHSIFEYLEVTKILSDDTVTDVTSLLLIVGSIFFLWAGWSGYKVLNSINK
jgi:hypothetical protein